MRKSALLFTFVLLSAGLAPASHAETIDMSTLTCAQILQGSADSTEAAIWISGYYNGMHKNRKLDLQNFEHNAKVIIEECRADPKKSVMKTIDTMLSRK